MIKKKSDMEKPKFEKVGDEKLQVINSFFSCACTTGLCFRHGTNRAVPDQDCRVIKQ